MLTDSRETTLVSHETVSHDTFEKRLARMEDISRQVQSGGVSLWRILELTREGKRLFHECEKELQASERELQIISATPGES